MLQKGPAGCCNLWSFPLPEPWGSSGVGWGGGWSQDGLERGQVVLRAGPLVTRLTVTRMPPSCLAFPNQDVFFVVFVGL